MKAESRNAIILAAGTSSRFVPLSQEIPKGLLEVKGEILIERQIRQLKEAGIDDICIVVGYKAEKFVYLKDKFGIELVINDDFDRYNNISSIIRVLDRLGNTFICSSDNYFPENVFLDSETETYYSALYATGSTQEYCIQSDEHDYITSVKIGGSDSWYMVGHVYFSAEFSKVFLNILAKEYINEETRHQYWEDVYIRHIDTLPFMKIHRYSPHQIEEFDSLEDLRKFDSSYIEDTRSSIIKEIASRLNCSESDLSDFQKIPDSPSKAMFSFMRSGKKYYMDLSDNSIRQA